MSNAADDERPLSEEERVLVTRLEAFNEATRSGIRVTQPEESELLPLAREKLSRAHRSLQRLRQTRPLPPAELKLTPHQSRSLRPTSNSTTTTAAERETTEVLYRRLRAVYTIYSLAMLYIVWVCYSGVLVGRLGAHTGFTAAQAVVSIDGGLLLAVNLFSLLLSAALLWARVPFGRRGLHRLENWNFLSQCLFFSVWEYGQFTMQPPGGFLGPAHHSTWLLYSLTLTELCWISQLITTGLILPKQIARCAWMMGSVAVVAAASLLLAASREPVVAESLPVLLPDLLTVTVGVGAICVFSSRKLRALERAAREAREMGQYRLQELLGSGGMGEVWLAEHRLLKRPCAIKLIRPERAGDPDALRRFEREVQATALLRHPNTIAVFDYGTAEDGTFYYMMEYLPGLSLDRVVARHGPLPPARVVHLLRQLCGALREAHEAGLVHRDLKPANVFVCNSGPADRAKLLDFGLVWSAAPTPLSADHTQEGRLVGTPGYMTPEQIEGRTIDARTDLYALGAVAYFALTGREPFVTDTAMRTLLAHLHDVPTPLREWRPEIPADLEAVTLQCLNKNPSDRPQSAADLERMLGRCGVEPWTDDDATAWWRKIGRG